MTGLFSKKKFSARPATLLMVVFTASLLLSSAAAPKKSPPASCHPAMAALMPDNAANQNGRYAVKSNIGSGTASFDLPFNIPCPMAGGKYPVKVVLALQHYLPPMLRVFNEKADKLQEDMLKKEINMVQRKRDYLKNADSIGEVSKEELTEGTVVYFEYETACAPGGIRSAEKKMPDIPHVFLKGNARTQSSILEITIEGEITASEAKQVFRDVSLRFLAADFTGVR